MQGCWVERSWQRRALWRPGPSCALFIAVPGARTEEIRSDYRTEVPEAVRGKMVTAQGSMVAVRVKCGLLAHLPFDPGNVLHLSLEACRCRDVYNGGISPPPTPGLCCTDAAGPGFISSDALSAPQASNASWAARPIRSVSNRQHRAGIACTATGRSIRRWVPAPPRLCNTDGTAPAARIPMFTLKFAFTTPVQHTIY